MLPILNKAVSGYNQGTFDKLVHHAKDITILLLSKADHISSRINLLAAVAIPPSTPSIESSMQLSKQFNAYKVKPSKNSVKLNCCSLAKQFNIILGSL